MIVDLSKDIKNVYYYNFSISTIGIANDKNGISDIFFVKDKINYGFVEYESDLIKDAYKQLKEYFKGERKDFDFKISLNGTEFQRKVWTELKNIPYGETRTYKQIAENIGNPKASRAVGLANNRNPIAIVIPCHRVIGANGSLTGYAGGLNIKKYLIELEKKI